MSEEHLTPPSPQTPPPEPEEFAKNWLWRILSGWLGARVAAIVFLIVVGTTTFRSEISEVADDLHIQIVEWWPLPKADPNFFTIALPRLDNDDDKRNEEHTIAQDLRDLSASNGVAVLEFNRTIAADDPIAGNTKARKWLAQSGAEVLIWGVIITDTSGKPGTEHLTEAVQTCNDALKGCPQESDARQWAEAQDGLGQALTALGERQTGTEELDKAKEAYKDALKVRTRELAPFDWARTQLNLGNVLDDLGKRTRDINELCQVLDSHVSVWHIFSEAPTTLRQPSRAQKKTCRQSTINRPQQLRPVCKLIWPT